MKKKPLISVAEYRRRVLRGIGAALLLIGFSLAMGTGGYMLFGHMGAVDGLINASMILTGMGPVDRMTDTAGKLFASFYALYSGLTFLTAVALFFGPVLHRFLHRFHLDVEAEEEDDKPLVVPKKVHET